MSNELRWNPILGSWVIVSSKRKSRPWRSGACPFCPGAPETGHGWEVLVLENKYPSLKLDAKTSRKSHDIYKVRPGYGVCEVVVETPDHEGDLDTLSPRNIVKYVEALRDETRKLCSDPGIKYVLPFRNKGEVIGVSLTHPHSQIYALPFIPPRVKVELKNAYKFWKEKGECIFCHIIGLEREEEIRLLYENDSFISFVPFFAMWPYEVHVYSKKHVGSLLDLNEKGIEDLSDALRVIVAMYNSLFSFSLPYMMIIHQSPCKKRLKYYHLHVEFYPLHRSKDKLKYPAGIEWGAWTFTYDDLPENKALELRKTLKKLKEKLSVKGVIYTK